MKKQLPTHGIANELAESSVFFPKAGAMAQEPHQEAPTVHESDAMPPRHHATMVSGNPAPKPKRQHDTGIPSNQQTTPPPPQETVPSATLEAVRKALKQFGKEAATYRFTTDEKQKLADIVYTYGRQGYKTSENEITRIAVNWLLLDYEAYGESSVLARLLEVLHR